MSKNVPFHTEKTTDFNLSVINVKPLNLSVEEKGILEDFSNKKISYVVFDSDVDDWSVGSRNFFDKVHLNSNLCFVIEDETNCKFGGVMFDKITVDNSWTSSQSAFIFSLLRNGKLNPKKFRIRDSKGFCYDEWDRPEEGAFVLYSDKGDMLFGFGGGYDIGVAKKGVDKSKCKSCTFVAGEKDLTNRPEFRVKRIMVYKLE
ncbi:hypothetical protein EIN_161830 [Entamoeba invadens IP1]|uniref:TLDc domain-containing protein n=1 Tax=Entamoeba invadens IP1 TaxID=370355 RepID=A0A0A1TYJ0_ENTIV|nr:hypothetical protein EIN_161830 [Entamoeba invadens IP1]ELP86559.1 hypothetical protein EIN_161830 [Entamoeba invadens IP1]|eukprot:XP_004185905.1 hypothetical protein EIN_161830 [Entamoeba invadens IP1]